MSRYYSAIVQLIACCGLLVVFAVGQMFKTHYFEQAPDSSLLLVFAISWVPAFLFSLFNYLSAKKVRETVLSCRGLKMFVSGE